MTVNVNSEWMTPADVLIGMVKEGYEDDTAYAMASWIRRIRWDAQYQMYCAISQDKGVVADEILTLNEFQNFVIQYGMPRLFE